LRHWQAGKRATPAKRTSNQQKKRGNEGKRTSIFRGLWGDEGQPPFELPISVGQGQTTPKKKGGTKTQTSDEGGGVLVDTPGRVGIFTKANKWKKDQRKSGICQGEKIFQKKKKACKERTTCGGDLRPTTEKS